MHQLAGAPQNEEPRCTPDLGRTPGALGETGVPLVCGMVLGLDGGARHAER
jgi:hypothetical protein